MKRGAPANDEDGIITIDDEEPYVAPPQPEPAKRVKKEEEPEDGDEPSGGPNDIVSQVQQLQKNFQRERGAGREAAARAQAAEEQNRTLRIEFENLTQKTDEAEARHAGQLEALRRELEETRRKATEREKQFQERLESLTQQLDAERSQVIKDLLRDRIDELTIKLAQDESPEQPQPETLSQLLQSQEMQHDADAELEDGLQQPQEQPTLQQLLKQEMQPDPEAADAEQQDSQQQESGNYRRSLEDLAKDPTNIFIDRDFIDPMNTISFYDAVDMVQELFDKSMKNFLKGSTFLKDEILYCPHCKKLPKSFHIYAHFLSQPHRKEIRHGSTRISRFALDYWLQKLHEAGPLMLEENANSAAARAAARAAAAAAGASEDEAD